MNNKSKKWTIILCTAIIVTGMMTACSKNGDNAASPSASQVTASPSGTSSPSPAPVSSEETKQGSGEYVGLADSHTVEIKSESGSASYQLGEETTDLVTKLKSGDAVSFEYTEIALEGDNAGTQLILTKIQKEAKAVSDDSDSQDNNTTKPSVDLPATKDFIFNMEGNEEMRTAKLAQGSDYTLYVFDQFSFDAQSSRLTMDVDKNYYVDIHKLPSGYKLEDVKKAAEKDLANVGEVRSIEAGEINSLLGGASMMLIGSNDKLTQEVIVKEVDGTGYLLEVNMPQGEPSEGFGPLAFTSMSSIANQ